jgi:hypothetical protein
MLMLITTGGVACKLTKMITIKLVIKKYKKRGLKKAP